MEVDGKIATILHFIHKDGKWNPNTLVMMEDMLETLTIKEKRIVQTPEKKKEIKDFYLLNYLDRYWEETYYKKIKGGERTSLC